MRQRAAEHLLEHPARDETLTLRFNNLLGAKPDIESKPDQRSVPGIANGFAIKLLQHTVEGFRERADPA